MWKGQDVVEAAAVSNATGRVASGSKTIDNRLVNNVSFENGERIATTKQIRNYKKQMKGMGINVVVDKKRQGFDREQGGRI